jgi:signal peptidase I
MKPSQSLKEISKASWIKLAIVSVLFFLWVLWVGNGWLLLIYPFIFDSYTFKYIKWGAWKHTAFAEKHKKLTEWVDALFFALVAVYLINLFFFKTTRYLQVRWRKHFLWATICL